MDKELLTKLRHEREVYRRWKLGQVNCEEYRKAFSMFIDNKRKTRKNMSLLMNETGNLNTEEAKVLNALFMSVFKEIK